MKADCGHEYKAEECAVGYAVNSVTGATMCYPCSDAKEREYMRTHDTIGCYVSSDGKSLTTWPGGKLARVYRLAKIRHNMAHEMYSVGATCDDDGSHWHGRGLGQGMCITMRRSKAK